MSYHPSVDLIRAILHLVPNAICSINNNDYDTLSWGDSRPKPSLSDLELAWEDIKKDIEFEMVRTKRNMLLTECDYTQLPDYNKEDKNAWTVYRETLRNIPQVYANPESVIWPTKPS